MNMRLPLPRRQRLVMATLIAVGMVAQCRNANAGDMKVALASYGVANALDAHSTCALIKRGGREAWLPTQSCKGVIGYQLTSTLALAWGDQKLPKKWRWVARSVMIVGKVIVVRRNSKVRGG